MCELAGIGRSELYRRWPSMTELRAALVEHLATSHPSWPGHLVGTSPSTPIDRAVREALGRTPFDVGALARAGLAVRPAGSPSREAVLDTERRWLSVIGAWAGQHLEAHGREPADGLTSDDVGVALAMVLEGLAVHRSLRFIRAPDGPPGLDVASCGAVVGRLVDALSVRSPASEPPAHRRWTPPEPLHTPEGAVVAHLARNISDERRVVALRPKRLVDPGQLAAELGVTERRIRMMWPDAAAFNADLVRHLVARHRAVVDGALSALLSVGFGERYEAYDELFTLAVDQVIRLGCQPVDGAPFGFVPSFHEPAVADVVADEIGAWVDDLRVPLLALLQGIGYSLSPDITPDQYTGTVFAAVLGADRAALMHPDLLERTVGGPDGPPLLALSLVRLMRAMADPVAEVADTRHEGEAPTGP